MDRRSPARKAAGLLFTSLALWSAAAAAAPGDPLGPPFTVNVYQADTEQPAAVVAGSTGFRVFWSSSSTGLSSMYQTRYNSAGTPLSGDVAVPDAYSSLDAAAAPDGRHVIVYSFYDGVRPRVLGQRYAASGAPAGALFEVTDPSLPANSRDIGQPRVAMNASGEFIVVWTQRKATGSSGSSCTGGFGGPRNCLGSYQTKIMARRYDSNGVAAGPVTVDSATFLTAMVYDIGVEAAGPEVDTPAVALANDGSYAVAWTSYTELTHLVSTRKRQVKLRHYPASGSAPLARTVADSGTHPAPEVAFDGAGNSIVLFRKHPFGDQSAASLWLRRYSTGNHNALGAAVRVDGGALLEQRSAARIATDGSGAFAVAWNAAGGVYLQRYAAGGVAAGGNVAVSSGGAQHRGPLLAAFGGRFLVSWPEAVDDFSLLDVRARIYEGP
ncbi:hypothetical protein D0B54_15600 [Solimonas sp. K1W22B-7]|uniref:hypothetical protein n=1 Tax=Solimonas sp. K1W22B-7 TaxID=2303331 RepID=UPI000E334C33|nr:hypothetical protein [Solimonas sp. K1W22B-7]AXQ30010.1 hypothetical protein D0B54_15600 [Solimonas sp. K1W22B-7]